MNHVIRSPVARKKQLAVMLLITKRWFGKIIHLSVVQVICKHAARFHRSSDNKLGKYQKAHNLGFEVKLLNADED